MPFADGQPGKHRPWWPFICFTAYTAAQVVLILVSAPTWARLIPVWIVLAILMVALAVLLHRRVRTSRRGVR